MEKQMKTPCVYLDYNATTPVDPKVLNEMLPYFSEIFGNPSSSHSFGQKALHGVDLARTRIAKFLGAKPDEIIFTGGGTEADNMTLHGIMNSVKGKKNHLIICMTEHSAIFKTCKHLEESGFTVTYLPVDNSGNISIEKIEKVITEETALISVMLANNETGIVQDIKQISNLIKDKNILLHTDAVHATGKIKFTVDELGVDLLSVSAHKIYGPKGIGALYIRRGINIQPILTGGGQERKLRAGTENVPGIVGLGKACELAENDLDKNIKELSSKRDRLEQGILSNIPFAKVNGIGSKRTPNTSNISFPGMESETILVKLDLNGIAVSSGSACGAASMATSRTLTSMQLPPNELYSSIRFSVGKYTTDEEIDYTIKTLIKICTK
jgi:cysteine desulfurase